MVVDETIRILQEAIDKLKELDEKDAAAVSRHEELKNSINKVAEDVKCIKDIL